MFSRAAAGCRYRNPSGIGCRNGGLKLGFNSESGVTVRCVLFGRLWPSAPLLSPRIAVGLARGAQRCQCCLQRSDCRVPHLISPLPPRCGAQRCSQMALTPHVLGNLLRAQVQICLPSPATLLGAFRLKSPPAASAQVTDILSPHNAASSAGFRFGRRSRAVPPVRHTDISAFQLSMPDMRQAACDRCRMPPSNITVI